MGRIWWNDARFIKPLYCMVERFDFALKTLREIHKKSYMRTSEFVWVLLAQCLAFLEVVFLCSKSIVIYGIKVFNSIIMIVFCSEKLAGFGRVVLTNYSANTALLFRPSTPLFVRKWS